MRRSGQPSRPSAITCCRFSSFKTLLTRRSVCPIVLNVLLDSLLAGFQVSLIGRFWVSPEVRGKYYRQAIAGTNLVLIEPDLADLFPDSELVNRALRAVAEAAQAATAAKRRRTA